jgi:UDP-N-acetylmuramate dehydrogenase
VSDDIYSDLVAQFSDLIWHTVWDNHKKLSAWQLIDVCGRKWYRIGDAGIYTEHALVLVNYGDATGEQMQTLVQQIQESVYDRFGVRLQTEVEMIG